MKAKIVLKALLIITVFACLLTVKSGLKPNAAKPTDASRVASTNQPVRAIEESTNADPAKEARNLQLSEMGFDPAAGHRISVNYTSSMSQNK
ncbi:MAG: hypothetical protein AAB610_02400 [Patescibacteria group bacterium]